MPLGERATPIHNISYQLRYLGYRIFRSVRVIGRELGDDGHDGHPRSNSPEKFYATQNKKKIFQLKDSLCDRDVPDGNPYPSQNRRQNPIKTLD